MALDAIFKLPPRTSGAFRLWPAQKLSESKKTEHIPHNELLDSIIEFGLITVIFFSFIYPTGFNKLVSFANLEYFIPLLFYTTICG